MVIVNDQFHIPKDESQNITVALLIILNFTLKENKR